MPTASAAGARNAPVPQERARRDAERSELAERFEEVAELLASVDITTVWDEADDKERRVLIEDLVDAVYVYPDHLRVMACGAPPLKVELTEVGLRPPAGLGTFVSEELTDAIPSGGWRLTSETGRSPDDRSLGRGQAEGSPAERSSDGEVRPSGSGRPACSMQIRSQLCGTPECANWF